MVNRCETKFAAGRTKVGVRFIVHSSTGIGGQRLAVSGWEHKETGGRGKATPHPSAALRRTESQRTARGAVPASIQADTIVTRSRPYQKEQGGQKAALLVR
jgi:hypothetical protein